MAMYIYSVDEVNLWQTATQQILPRVLLLSYSCATRQSMIWNATCLNRETYTQQISTGSKLELNFDSHFKIEVMEA